MTINDIKIDSPEKDILEFCKNEADQAPGYGHEMKLNYGLNLLSIKQQKKLIDDQNTYNQDQLFWSRVLAVATICLAIATVLLVTFH